MSAMNNNAGSAPRKKPELLAPAGGWEQMEAAIRFGADAIYMGTDRFGMRQRAENFTLENMPKAVEYAHEHGVKVHVTLNTLMHEEDFEDLPHYVQALDEAGVDVLIVSDMGAFSLIREIAPRIDLHVSTQASVSNTRSALEWYRMGAKRIVLARELSLAAIADMRKKLPDDLELECFVHGSMCMAVSGRCLISDYMTGRSATNGHCTQPCRWNYALVEEKRPGQFFPIEEDGSGSYIMNAHDMNMLSHLDELAAAGVDSLKIEGRNKKAFYVATVVNAYRQVLDGADPELFQPELDTVSHRPYDTGFYFGPAHQAVASDEYLRYYDWAADVLACEQLGDEEWEVEVACRNRFAEGDTMEVLSPREPIRSFTVRDIRLIPEQVEGFPPLPAEPVETANRAMEHYLIRVPLPLKEHDILRIARPGRTTARRFKPTFTIMRDAVEENSEE